MPRGALHIRKSTTASALPAHASSVPLSPIGAFSSAQDCRSVSAGRQWYLAVPIGAGFWSSLLTFTVLGP